jgi:hypothetical protein
LTRRIIVEIVATANIVEIDCPELDIGYSHQTSSKKLFSIDKVVETKLHLDPFDPDVSLVDVVNTYHWKE